MTLLQVGGRFLILFVVLQPAEEIHEHLVVFVLFLVWSLVEVVRWVIPESSSDIDKYQADS